MSKLDQDRRKAADVAFQDYNFKPMEVIASESWVDMGSIYQKVIYIAQENKPSFAETFVVEFSTKASRIVSVSQRRN